MFAAGYCFIVLSTANGGAAQGVTQAVALLERLLIVDIHVIQAAVKPQKVGHGRTIHSSPCRENA